MFPLLLLFSLDSILLLLCELILSSSVILVWFQKGATTEFQRSSISISQSMHGFLHRSHPLRKLKYRDSQVEHIWETVFCKHIVQCLMLSHDVSWMQVLPLGEEMGFRPDLHEVQLLGLREQVSHAGMHEKHCLLSFNCVPSTHLLHITFPSVPTLHVEHPLGQGWHWILLTRKKPS